MRARWLVAASCLTSALLGLMASARPDPPAAAQDRQTLENLFAAYEAGDYDVVARRLATAADFGGEGKAVEALVASWGKNWRPVHATFVLEVAIAASDSNRSLAVSRILGAGGTYVLRRPTPLGVNPREDRYEMLWHQAAVGLLLRMGWAEEEQKQYLEVMDRRYRSAPATAQTRFALEWVLSRTYRCCSRSALRALENFGPPHSTADLGGRGGLDASGTGASVSVARGFSRVPTAAELQDAVTAFDDLRKYPHLRAEASVRGAFMLLHEDRPHDALAWLDAMGNDRDRAVSFWAALVRGYALDALGRTTDAASAFQEALSIVPHAQSASIALMLDLARLGQREDAGAVAEAATRDSSVDDPWWEYDRGDFRFVKTWLDELRKDNR